MTSPHFIIQNQIWNVKDPKIMAILNITPDSFYDGGKHFLAENYSTVAKALIEQGADIIDIGGESTRPGSDSIDEQEEIRRILPAIQQIRAHFHIPISIDTTKLNVAEAALAAGADLINDVSGLSAGEKMVQLLNQYQASYCLMHTQGLPKTMQNQPTYQNVILEIEQFFQQKLQFCETHGLNKNRILIDPGIGFGKTLEHNLTLIKGLKTFTNLESLVMVGLSQKSFLGQILDKEVDARNFGTLAAEIHAFQNGATVFRVHHPQQTKDALTVTTKLSFNK